MGLLVYGFRVRPKTEILFSEITKSLKRRDLNSLYMPV